MSLHTRNANTIKIAMRVLIALIGGFVLANLVAILISYSSISNKVDAIVAGMMVSFIVYTLAAIFAFATKKTRNAALGVFFACLVSFSIVSYIEMVFI